MFVADATGLPALGRLIEQLPAGVSAKAIVEVVDESHRQHIESAADVEFIWLVGSGNGIAPSKLPDAVRALKLPTEPGYVWVAGESTMLRDIRKYLRHELKLPAQQYKVIGYWTYKAEVWNAKYEALDETIRAQLDAAWQSDRDEEEIRDEVDKTLECGLVTTAVNESETTAELIDESLAEKQKQPAGLVETNSRRTLGLVICLAVLGCVVLVSIAVGSKTIPFGTVVDALVNYDDSNDHVIIRDLRLPAHCLACSSAWRWVWPAH